MAATRSLSLLLERVRARIDEHDACSLDQLRAIIDSLDVAAFVADERARFVATNVVASELTGYTAQELRRLHVYDITSDGSAQDVDVLWRAFVQQGAQSGGYQVRTKRGRLVAVEYAAATSVVPGLHLSLLRAVPTSRRSPGR